MAGVSVLHPKQCHYITRLSRVQFLTAVSMHPDYAAHALFFTRVGIEDVLTFFDASGVNAHECQCSVAIIHDLKS